MSTGDTFTLASFEKAMREMWDRPTFLCPHAVYPTHKDYHLTRADEEPQALTNCAICGAALVLTKNAPLDG